MILITGATGHVGAGLANLLVQTSGLKVAALVRRPSPTLCPSIRQVCFDLTKPGMGLPLAVRDALCSEVTHLVHAAADTRFTTPLALARAVNCDGTAHLLDLASSCSRLRMFLHVSSVYIAGSRSGVLAEQPLTDTPQFPSAYLQSKFESERIVQTSPVPWSIVRLSTLDGLSTGCPEQSNYFHQLLRLVPQYSLPFVPAHPQAQVDLVSSAWISASLSFLLQAATAGRVYQLCAGPARTMAFSEVLHLAFKAYGKAAPRVVDASRFEMMFASPRFAQLFGSLQPILPHLAVCQTFANEQTLRLLPKHLHPEPVQNVFRNLLRHYTLAVRADFGSPRIGE